MKRTTAALLAVMAAVTLALCSCSAKSDAPMDMSSYPAAPQSADSGGYYGAENGRDDADSYGEIYGDATPDVLPADRKIIKNAWLDINAGDAAGLYANIAAYAAHLGGYEHSYSISNYEDYSVIDAVIKIPPEYLTAFIGFIGENGEVINSRMGSDDITDGYFDAETRLSTKRKSLERYYELMSNATGIEEIVYIQKTIDGITEDIETLEGRLRLWDSQVDMATVTLYIRQNNDPIQIKKDISWNTLSLADMGYLIKRGFLSVTNTIASAVQWVAVVLVGYSPIWLILGAGAVVWRVTKKKRLTKRGPGGGAQT